MGSISMRALGVAEASVEEKLELIDELWESVRRSGLIDVREDHLEELERRISAVKAEPSIALSPTEARAQFRK